ncbi:carcinine transporter-like [Copidosoma floridanum]|uniref:carcinine transporter-like n=1 Tax=Copidosoma floridanum TaxID=29053 RepID=UPI0006C9A2DD|nr:carcinine transporter-like [Copidosoma floridanum]
MVYVGLSYYGPALGDEEHLSFLFSSLAEIPSYVACWFVMDRWGRRWPLCICMVVAGTSCIATVLLPPDAVLSTLVLFLLSKSAISASFLIIYPFAGELYPTRLRGIAIGFSAYISGLGLVIIPFITYLGRDNLVLPLALLGAISVIGGISGLRLPETLHQRLPQTIEEGELFGIDWTWKDCCQIQYSRTNGQTISSQDSRRTESIEIRDLPNVTVTRNLKKKNNINHLAHQTSIMETQRDCDGSMKMAYWF